MHFTFKITPLKHNQSSKTLKCLCPCATLHVSVINLDHLQGYCSTENTLQLIKSCRKSCKMNYWENMYIQIYGQHGKLIEEQQANEINPLFGYASWRGSWGLDGVGSG
jgi:hypothetical protein